MVEPNFFKGWNNQLVIYDIESNSLSWPLIFGQDTPGPRAAHATCCDEKRGLVYLFGGRLSNERLNDFYVGDLTVKNQVHWTQICQSSEGSPWPCGRSWHTLSYIGPEYLLLYGGYDNDAKPLNDCWFFNIKDNSWMEMKHLSKSERLWHTAHFVKAVDALFLFGGVSKNILHQEEQMHPKTVDSLQISPLPLYLTALQVVEKNPVLQRKFASIMPPQASLATKSS